MECATCLLMGMCLLCGHELGDKTSSGRPLTDEEMRKAVVNIVKDFRVLNAGLPRKLSTNAYAGSRSGLARSFERRKGFFPDLRFSNTGIGKRAGGLALGQVLSRPYTFRLENQQDGFSALRSQKFSSKTRPTIDSFSNAYHRFRPNSNPGPLDLPPSSSSSFRASPLRPYLRRRMSELMVDNNLNNEDDDDINIDIRQSSDDDDHDDDNDDVVGYDVLPSDSQTNSKAGLVPETMFDDVYNLKGQQHDFSDQRQDQAKIDGVETISPISNDNSDEDAHYDVLSRPTILNILRRQV